VIADEGLGRDRLQALQVAVEAHPHFHCGLPGEHDYAVLLVVSELEGEATERVGHSIDCSPVPVLVGCCSSSCSGALDALAGGASDVLPVRDSDWDSLLVEVAARGSRMREVESILANPLIRQHAMGNNPAWLAALRELIAAASLSQAPVLLLGETGTGKDLLARLVHTWIVGNGNGTSGSSIAPRSHQNLRGANCLAMNVARSPVRWALGVAPSRRPTRERCFSMRWANCRSKCRRGYCARELRHLMHSAARAHCGSGAVSLGCLPRAWREEILAIRNTKRSCDTGGEADGVNEEQLARQCNSETVSTVPSSHDADADEEGVVRAWLGQGLGLQEITQRAGDLAIATALAQEGNHVGRAARLLGVTERAIQLRKTRRAAARAASEGDAA